MEAFGIHVHHTDKLNFYNWAYFYKNELSVSVSGRLVHAADGVRLVSRELAEQYKNAITARRVKSGDREFDAEVVSVSSPYPDFFKSVMKDSEVIREKLEKWNYPTPQNITISDSGWVIRVQHDDQKQCFYLMTLGKNSMKLCENKDMAKIYKTPKLRAFATNVE